MAAQGLSSRTKLCGACNAAPNASHMRHAALCELGGNASSWQMDDGPALKAADNKEQLEEDASSDVSLASVASACSEPELRDLSLPSDLEDGRRCCDGDEGDVDVDEPVEAGARPISIDLSALWTDWPLVRNILVLYEKRLDELVRLWDLLQAVVLLIGSRDPQLTCPRPFALQLPPAFTPEKFWAESPIIQSVLDPDHKLSWPAFQLQMKEFILVAALFAEPIHHELFAPNLF